MRTPRPSRARLVTSLGLIGALTLAATLALAQPVPEPYRVIVHPSSTLQSLDRRYLAEVFLKKTTRWPNGDAIRPVDLDADSRVRREFSSDVIGRSVASVKSYWAQIIFAGRGLPPPELASEAAVVTYVLSQPGAIGYISGTGDAGLAKVIPVR